MNTVELYSGPVRCSIVTDVPLPAAAYAALGRLAAAVDDAARALAVLERDDGLLADTA